MVEYWKTFCLINLIQYSILPLEDGWPLHNLRAYGQRSGLNCWFLSKVFLTPFRKTIWLKINFLIVLWITLYRQYLSHVVESKNACSRLYTIDMLKICIYSLFYMLFYEINHLECENETESDRHIFIYHASNLPFQTIATWV